MNRIKNYKKMVVITLSFLLMFSLIVPSAQNNVFAEGRDEQVEEKIEDSENIDNNKEEQEKEEKNKEENESNVEDEEKEQTKETEDSTLEDIEEEIKDDIVEPNHPLGEISNRSLRVAIGEPTLEEVNKPAPDSYDIYKDSVTKFRYSLLWKPSSGSYVVILEKPDNRFEYPRNPDGGITIPDKLGGYPLVGIRKGAFRGQKLTGEIKFTMEDESGPLPTFYIGDLAFAENEITGVAGRITQGILIPGRAGIGIFRDNHISDISAFLANNTDEVSEYHIPTLTFMKNKIKNADFTSNKVVTNIGVMAFANNKMETITGLTDRAAGGLVIFSGAFYDNNLTTDVINALPDNVVFSSDTTDIFGGDSKRIQSDGTIMSTGYLEGLGAFQRNNLTTVPTVKPGWKFGYRTFAKNNITGELVFDTAMMNASLESEGLFITNPITSIRFNLENVTSAQAVIPKEFVAKKIVNTGHPFSYIYTTNFRDAWIEDPMLEDFELNFMGATSPSGDPVPTVIKEGAFRGTNLKGIKNLNYVSVIEKEAFAACDELKFIESDSYGGALAFTYSIEDRAFFGCPSLEGQIMLSNRIKVGSYAFAMNNLNVDILDPNAKKGKISSIKLYTNPFLEVPNSGEYESFDIGVGAFQYQGLRGILSLDQNLTEPLNKAYHLREYAFAHNQLYGIYTDGISDSTMGTLTTHFYSKCFVGNQFIQYNPGNYGIGTLAVDAFSNQNIPKIYVDQQFSDGTFSLNLGDHASANSGISGITLNKVSSALIYGGNVSEGGVSVTLDGENPTYMRFGNYKPEVAKMSYKIENANGNSYNNATVDVNLELKYDYEIKYQIGNPNNGLAGFDLDMSQKNVLKYVKEEAALVTSAPTIHSSPGYAVAGWYDNPECTGTPISNTAKATISTTIYAKIVESFDVTFHSGENAEFGSIGSGIRKKIMKVPNGTSLRNVFGAMNEEARNAWNVAFDTTSPENVDMRRHGDWYTDTNFPNYTYEGNYHTVIDTSIRNRYRMERITSWSIPRNLYADVDRFKIVDFRSSGVMNPTSGLVYKFSAHDDAESGLDTFRIVWMRYGSIIKDMVDNFTEAEQDYWKLKYDTTKYERISYKGIYWVTWDDEYFSDYTIPVSANTVDFVFSMLVEKKGTITLHSGDFAEFGTVGSGIREQELKIYDGMQNRSLSEIIDMNMDRNPDFASSSNIAYDHSKYELDTKYYTNPQLTTLVDPDVPYMNTYGDITDVYMRLTPLGLDGVIPDPDNPDTPLWGVEVPREVHLENREVDVKTKLVSLTGYDEAFGTDLNVNLYIRSQNGMKLKRANSTEELKYRVILGNASLGGTSSNQGTTDTLAGTFTIANKTIQGSARVLEESSVMDTYKDNLVFKIQTQIIP